MIFPSQIRIHMFQRIKMGSLIACQFPPGILLCQLLRFRKVLIRRIQYVSSDATARHSHRYVNVEFQFCIYVCVQLKFELEPAVEKVSRLRNYQIYDDGEGNY